MNQLEELANLYKTDKGTTFGGCHNYTEIYDKYFSQRRNCVQRVLEIGIYQGASLFMWRDYFPNATIHGIDINDCSRFASDRVVVHIGSQGDTQFLNSLDLMFDIIIDDGSHVMSEQQISYQTLIGKVVSGGFYAIEDLQTSADPAYGGGGSDSTVAMLLSLRRNLATNQDICAVDIFHDAYPKLCILTKR